MKITICHQHGRYEILSPQTTLTGVIHYSSRGLIGCWDGYGRQYLGMIFDIHRISLGARNFLNQLAGAGLQSFPRGVKHKMRGRNPYKFLSRFLTRSGKIGF